jgi:hypothetical protein
MEFRVLGPLEVVEDGRRLAIQTGRQRALLALLVINANRAVSADRIIDELWGDDGPESGAKAVAFHVSKLRDVLEPGPPEDWIEWGPRHGSGRLRPAGRLGPGRRRPLRAPLRGGPRSRRRRPGRRPALQPAVGRRNFRRVDLHPDGDGPVAPADDLRRFHRPERPPSPPFWLRAPVRRAPATIQFSARRRYTEDDDLARARASLPSL